MWYKFCFLIPWLEYVQPQHLWKSPEIQQTFSCPLTPFEELLTKQDNITKGLISIIYNTLLSMYSKIPLSYTFNWEKDCLVILPESTWSGIWSFTSSVTKSINILQLQYKIISHWYTTPTKLHHINKSFSPPCCRQCGEVGTYLHCWWECPKVNTFWTQIIHQIYLLTGHTLSDKTEDILLNLWHTLLIPASDKLFAYCSQQLKPL